jgi:hypothetical protein
VCAEAGGEWVGTDIIRERCGRSRPTWDPADRNRAVNEAIQLLAAEGRIEIEPKIPVRVGDRAGQRKVRLTAGSVEPAPQPKLEAPTGRTREIADVIRRHPLTEAEAEFIHALLPPEHG